MSEIRPLGNLISGELFDLPSLAADPQGGYAHAQRRDEWLQKRKRDAFVANREAGTSLAILTIASELNFDVLDSLDIPTQEAVLAVRDVTPQEYLTELAIRYHSKSK